MHGKGALIYPNGERYEGSWCVGERVGVGGLRRRAAVQLYARRCSAQLLGGWPTHRAGRVRVAAGPLLTDLRYSPPHLTPRPPPPRRVYGKRHGYGSYHYLDGGRYEGEWMDGRINGFGSLTYADGDKYVGAWTDGKMNGQGTYVYADGDKYEVRGAGRRWGCDTCLLARRTQLGADSREASTEAPTLQRVAVWGHSGTLVSLRERC